MTRGRKPKPTALKKLSGNPGKRKINRREPKPDASPSLREPPKWLDNIAKEEWRRKSAELLQLNLLTNLDDKTLEAYCKAYSRWRQAEAILDKNQRLEFVAKNGYATAAPQVTIALRYLHEMHAWAAKLGFSPADRVRLQVEKPDESDSLEQFAARRDGQLPDAIGDHAPSGTIH